MISFLQHLHYANLLRVIAILESEWLVDYCNSRAVRVLSHVSVCKHHATWTQAQWYIVKEKTHCNIIKVHLNSKVNIQAHL